MTLGQRCGNSLIVKVIYRSFTFALISMTNLKRLLTDNKAQTLEEAVELYKSRSI